jgi:chemotaxis protein histidine kinase CheA
MDRDPVLTRLLGSFLNETRDICARVSRILLEMENAKDEPSRRPLCDELARGLHTLKGNSDSFGFPDLGELAHFLESVLAPFRKGQVPIPAADVDLLLHGMDAFAKRLHMHTLGGDGLEPIEELLATLRTGQGLSTPSPETQEDIALATLTIAPDAEEDWRVHMRHVIALMNEVERLREIRLRLDERRREIDQTLRRLDSPTGDETEVRLALESLSRSISSDAGLTSEIVGSFEDQVKAIATLPVREILDPLHRAVRDLCRSLGKAARLSVVGAEITLDRRSLGALKGPLVHLIRNAVDHGIEMPDERVAKGKHREGAIVVRMEQHGNILSVEVEDDGRGIDLERVRARALERGLYSAEELTSMSSRDVHQILFRPGFSTRADVTEISGRGVGLDVVRTRVQSVNGQVELSSTSGQGTRFHITVPMEIGSSPVVVVRSGEHMLGVPMVAVETTRPVRKEQIQGGRRMWVSHQGQMIPLHDLGAVLGLRQSRPPPDGTPLVVVQARGQRIGMVVDELVGDLDLVVRALPSELTTIEPYQGAATLSRGELLLVLRAEWLIDQRLMEAPRPSAHALVVDDSLTARALHRTILESGGYTVHTVSGAKQALEQLRYADYDVVISDIEMTEMDGFELLARLRASEDTASLPVILVSAHDTSEERRRGVLAGADAFLSKKECVSGRLLAEVASVVARRRGMA